MTRPGHKTFSEIVKKSRSEAQVARGQFPKLKVAPSEKDWRQYLSNIFRNGTEWGTK